MSNCITEFNEEVYRRGLLEEGRVEGERFVIEKMFKNGMDLNAIATILEVPTEVIESMLKTVSEE